MHKLNNAVTAQGGDSSSTAQQQQQQQQHSDAADANKPHTSGSALAPDTAATDSVDGQCASIDAAAAAEANGQAGTQTLCAQQPASDTADRSTASSGQCSSDSATDAAAANTDASVQCNTISSATLQPSKKRPLATITDAVCDTAAPPTRRVAQLKARKLLLPPLHSQRKQLQHHHCQN